MAQAAGVAFLGKIRPGAYLPFRCIYCGDGIDIEVFSRCRVLAGWRAFIGPFKGGISLAFSMALKQGHRTRKITAVPDNRAVALSTVTRRLGN